MLRELFHSLILGVGILLYSCSCQYELNLNEWLTEFSDCHVAIISIGKENISVGNFDYPIRLRSSKTLQRFDYTGSRFQKFQPRFCTVQATIISKSMVKIHQNRTFQWQDRLYPDDPYTTRVYISGLTDESTNSFSFNIVVLPDDVRITPGYLYKLNPEDSYRNDDQHFNFVYTSKPNMNLQIISAYFYEFSGYAGRMGLYHYLWYIKLDVLTRHELRLRMQDTIRVNYRRGRNVVAGLRTSFAPPFLPMLKMNEDQYYNNIHTSQQMFDYTRKMTFRDYYFKYRGKVSYLRANQANLFEHIGSNISKLPKDISLSNPKYLLLIRTEAVKRCDDIVYGQLGTYNSLSAPGFRYPSGSTYFNFMTCDGLRQNLTFGYYIQPFDLYTWCLFAAMVVSIALILLINSIYDNETKDIISTNFKYCFYCISVVLENGFGSINQRRYLFSITYAIFVFALFVIGNYYKAVFTMDIAAPLQRRISVEKVHELINWSIATLPYPHIESNTHNYIRQRLSTLSQGNGLQVTEPNSFIYVTMYSPLGSDSSRRVINSSLVAVALLKQLLESDITRLFASQQEVLNHISTCDKKAFIGDLEQLKAFQKFSQNRVNFGVGKDRFLPRTYYWFIPKRCGKFLPRRLGLLFSSGIYDQIVNIFNARTRDEIGPELKTSVEEKQKLDSHLGHFFFIYLGSALIGTAAFLIELLVGDSPEMSNMFDLLK